MIDIKDKLDQLIKAQDWHEDSFKIFKEWASDVDKLEINKSFLELPITVELAEKMKSIIKRAKSFLDDRNLSEKDRQYYFALKDVALVFYNVFSIEENNNSLNSIEQEIDEELNKLK